ncbi:two-component system CitB family sensor kinase [Leucobacter exalbidus]|uniref:histidine kinase n=1 Tax=Leucobacter exalbidus TaxID=662960 RepID=A0A940T4J2_9MICO|nr:ATP-binding protein [Leucobacter exalbidus]MBP1326879.1 two-component system CitB family sensor kinase [Leucobacter exalbidus]
MTRPDRVRLRLTTRTILAPLGIIAAILALCVSVYWGLAAQQLRKASETSALSIARTVAEDVSVRELVTEYSRLPGTPPAAELQTGELQQAALALAPRTGALFIVITDDHGIRLAHPHPSRLGLEVSTPYEQVLLGNEVVEWEEGTLGESARAKVPIFGLEPGDDTLANGEPVGEVSVGFKRESVFTNLPTLVGFAVLFTLALFALAASAMLLIRRRLELATLGLQPDDLTALVQHQTAVLDGISDGMLGIDADGIVQVCNSAAETLLGLDSPVGSAVAQLGIPVPLTPGVEAGIDAVPSPSPADRPRSIVHNGRTLLIEQRAVVHNGKALGWILIVRDQSDVVTLHEQLETAQAVTSALRVQRHEFANRIHVATGLIDANRVTEARDFLGELSLRGSVEYPVPGLDALDDEFFRSFIKTKAIEAGAHGVRLRVADDSHVMGTLYRPEATATVLGNLIDNAVQAAVKAPAPRWVEVSALNDQTDLILTVTDSGAGITDGVDVFDRTVQQRGPAAAGSGERAANMAGPVHGHGVGISLAREIVCATGGDLWVVDPGGPGHGGAVFAARITQAVSPLPYTFDAAEDGS